MNAVVSLDEERARAGAAEADERLARGEAVGPLHGLPHAFKDTHEVAGWRTTFGSPLREQYVPKRDDLVAERIRAAGVVTIGKTNVPEWAAGSHTFNPIFGTTRNPYDLSRSAGGSSGGAAAALASGMVPLADGSDMGGSLRNPASFNNVVGLRPSVGRVPNWPTTNGWELTSVGGPMARNVEDLALLLSVLAGPTRRAPLSLETPGSAFAPPLHGDLAGAPRRPLGRPRRRVPGGPRRRRRGPGAGGGLRGARGRRRGRPPGAAQRRRGVPDPAGLGVPVPLPHAAGEAARRASSRRCGTTSCSARTSPAPTSRGPTSS